MKTIKIIFLMTSMVLVFERCQNDEPAPVSTVKPVGIWEEVSYVTSECSDPGNNQTNTCTSSCEILVITATTISFDGVELPYTVKGNTITVSFGGDTGSGTFVLTETTLTITSKDSHADGNCKNVSTYKKHIKKVTDIDGNVYNTIFIGSQEWMKENLKTTHYNDGSEILNVTQTSDWINSTSGAYCDFDNNASNVPTYGKIYNGYAVAENRNVCPTGWHVPSLDEWDLMINTLGGENVAGGKMKATGTLQAGDGLWYAPNTGATNSSEFTGLPAGTRFDAGDFRDLHSFASWRSSDGWTMRLQDTHTKVEKFYNYSFIGTSVRCVKD